VFGSSLESDLCTPQFVRVFDGASCSQRLIEPDGEHNRHPVADLLIQADDGTDVLGNRICLDLREAGVQHRASNLIGKLLE